MVKAYHFLKADMRAGKGNEPPWQVGESRTYHGTVALCLSGYHSCPTPWDALAYAYAPAMMLCLVEVSEPVVKQHDKQVSKTRTLLKAINITTLCHEFACRVAEDVLPLYEQAYPYDKRPRLAVEAKRKWLKGEINNKALDAARDAAGAAWDAAWAAGDAAWAAGDAARAARVAGAAWAAWAARAAGAAWAAWAARDAAKAARVAGSAGAAWAAWAARDAARAARVAGDATRAARTAGTKYMGWFNEACYKALEA